MLGDCTPNRRDIGKRLLDGFLFRTIPENNQDMRGRRSCCPGMVWLRKTEEWTELCSPWAVWPWSAEVRKRRSTEGACREGEDGGVQGEGRMKVVDEGVE